MRPDDPAATIELDSLGLAHGDGTSVTLPVETGPVTLGGQQYRADPAAPSVRLDVSRTTTGYALRLRFELALEGPCFRCLEPAVNRIMVDVREVDQPPEESPGFNAGHRAGQQPAPDDDPGGSAAELQSPYVSSDRLDLAGWVHDALILSLPTRILCRDDCRGLCTYCGESLNDADPAAHDHGQNLDPRWAKLRDLG